MPIPSRSRRFGAVLAAVVLLLEVVPTPSVLAVSDDTPITIDGGGWGHHIGIPQWATQGQGLQGWVYDDILDYWYPGTQLVQSTGVYWSNGVPAPDPIRIGIDYVDYGDHVEHRGFRWQDFQAMNGDVSICLGGEAEGSCSYTAHPGETWRYGRQDVPEVPCYLNKDGAPQAIDPSQCEVHLYWGDQPNVQVKFPGGDVGRTFARGHIEMVPFVEGRQDYAGWNVFNFVVELPVEEYLYGLGEVPPSWELETLKANVVASRSYAAYRSHSGHPNCSCDMVWDTTGQSYKGWMGGNSNLTEGDTTNGAKWRQAAVDTAGEVLIFDYDGHPRIAETYFSTISGGATENVWDMWGPDTPTYRSRYAYLGWKEDLWSPLFDGTHTGGTPAYPKVTNAVWTKDTTAGAIRGALTEDGIPIFDEILSMDIVHLRDSGSPDDIKVTGYKNDSLIERHYTGNELKSKLGLVSHFIYDITGFHTPERWAGANRYSTAVAVSQKTYPGGADVVYLAVGTNHPDALAGGPAAAHEGGPILLVTPTALPTATAAELQRLDPVTVVVLGGPVAVSDAVLAAVDALLPATDVVRRSGADRYGTAAAISQGAFAGPVDTVFVVTGEAFPDALIASPAAVASGSPVLLVRANSVPAATAAEIQRLAPSHIVVVGGPAAVSDATLDALKALVPDTTRVSAADRYALSAKLSQTYFPSTKTVYVAVGTTFADALTAGPASAVLAGPVLLVRYDSIPPAIAAELHRLRPTRIVILGGPAAVSAGVEDQLKWSMG